MEADDTLALAVNKLIAAFREFIADWIIEHHLLGPEGYLGVTEGGAVECVKQMMLLEEKLATQA